jgi:hypothetical protein
MSCRRMLAQIPPASQSPMATSQNEYGALPDKTGQPDRKPTPKKGKIKNSNGILKYSPPIIKMTGKMTVPIGPTAVPPRWLL